MVRGYRARPPAAAADPRLATRHRSTKRVWLSRLLRSHGEADSDFIGPKLQRYPGRTTNGAAASLTESGRPPAPDAALVGAISRRPIELIQASELLVGSGAQRTILEVFQRVPLRCLRIPSCTPRGRVGRLSARRLRHLISATGQDDHRNGEEVLTHKVLSCVQQVLTISANGLEIVTDQHDLLRTRSPEPPMWRARCTRGL